MTVVVQLKPRKKPTPYLSFWNTNEEGLFMLSLRFSPEGKKVKRFQSAGRPNVEKD